jgi:hypothetical protein
MPELGIQGWRKAQFILVGATLAIVIGLSTLIARQFVPDRIDRNDNMTGQQKIVDDAIALSNQISRALSSSGYKADFSLESLKEIDRFFDDQAVGGRARPDGFLSQELGARIFALGAYVGEVIRRHNGGQWQGNDDDPQAEINLSVRFKTGAIIWPVQRVMKRFKNGPEDGIWVYGAVISEKSTN